MKKYLVWTSLLTLIACGGGGGSGGGDGSVAGGTTVSGGYVAPRAAVTAAVASSNGGITGMNSEIVVASNSTSPVSVIRQASAINGDVTYTSYRLDDVKLYTAESGDAENTYINMNLDENTGEINAVKMVLNGEESGFITRTKNGDNYENTFDGPVFEYVANGDDRAVFRIADNGQTMEQLNQLAAANNLTGGHWNRIDEKMDFHSYGKDKQLQYADFGYFNPVNKSKNKELTAEVVAAIRSGRDAVLALGRGDDLDKVYTDEQIAKELAKKDYQLYAGGYAISGIQMDKSLTPQNGTSYSGTAIGRVYASIHSLADGTDKTAALQHWNVPYDQASDNEHPEVLDEYSNDAGHDMADFFTTNDATLTIDENGNKVLLMPFNTKAATGSNKFYDIQMSQNSGNQVTGVKFTGDESAIAAHLREQESLGLDTNGSVDMENHIAKASFKPGYYGVNTPEEAAGTAYLQANDVIWTDVDQDNKQLKREYEVQAAWGMTKD